MTGVQHSQASRRVHAVVDERWRGVGCLLLSAFLVFPRELRLANA